MAKLKTFEEYIADIDSAEEIEKEIVDMGEPETAEGGEDFVSDDQPKAKAPAKSEDEGAGEDAEEMEADTKEVHSEEDKKIVDPADQEMPEDEGEEGAVEVEESILEEEDEDENGDEIVDEIPGEDDQVEADDDEESDEDEDDEDEDDEDEDDEDEDEEGEDDAEEAKEEPRLVTDILHEAFGMIKNEAKVWEEDAHDTHTVESYLNENAALLASLACNTLTEMKKDITLEQYEAACNGLKEAYSKKISEMIEAFDADGEVTEVE